MKLTHQLKGWKTEKDLNEGAPLSLFLADKKGGILSLDSNTGKLSYSPKIGDSRVTIEISTEGKVNEVKNQYHSLGLSTEDGNINAFLPVYMNSLSIESQGQPINISVKKEMTRTGSAGTVGVDDVKCALNENGSGLNIEIGDLHLTLLGAELNYQIVKSKSKLKRKSKIKPKRSEKDSGIMLNVSSKKLVLSLDSDKNLSLASAMHLYKNEEVIKEAQEGYLTPSKKFVDPEHALAYSTIVNATDNMFVSSQGSIMPIPFFSEFTNLYPAIAAQSFLAEGEFGTAKDLLVKDMGRWTREKGSFMKKAWSNVVFGKMLNDLCQKDKLYSYFSQEDISDFKKLLVDSLNSTDKDHTDAALRLVSYRLAHALTKSEEYSEVENNLQKEVRDSYDALLERMGSSVTISDDDLKEAFLTPYLYPELFSNDAWRYNLDIVMGKIGDFRRFRRITKSSQADKKVVNNISLELFGVMSMAATVLTKIDKLHFKTQIDNIMERNVQQVLYTGTVGLPNLSYDIGSFSEKGSLMKDAHLLNNALFLEMLRTCSL